MSHYIVPGFQTDYIWMFYNVCSQANLPLLQRELLHCARLAKQSPQQYLAHNEHILFDPSHSPLETQDSELNENGKRVSPDR